ncbi:MAG TPA: methyltransferase domain-containing protein [Thermoanaerobaculia bacterium]|nr:methyltransferase domain-containing protein [Thermoanaerobaculia bacterium]
MLSLDEQLRRGALACPVTGSPLRRASESSLVSLEGRSYRLAGSVPILLADEPEIEKSLADAGGAMVQEYTCSAAGPAGKASRPSAFSLASLNRLLHVSEIIRSDAANAAFSAVVGAQPEGALLLSIGGGPRRVHPGLVNVNIGLFENVDVVADGYRLPYVDGSVDACHCEAVLEHMEEPWRAVAEMFRVLRPGGQVFAATPFLQAFHAYPNHFQNFTLEGQRRLFERAGFEVLAAGACVGPTFAIADLTLEYLRVYVKSRNLSRFLRLPLAAVFRLLLRLDRRLLRDAPASDLASTTFVHARKPEAQP